MTNTRLKLNAIRVDQKERMKKKKVSGWKLNQRWQDDFKEALRTEGEAFRADKKNFPKLWIKSEENVDNSQERLSFSILFSPTPGIVYGYRTQQHDDSESMITTHSETLSKPGSKSEAPHSESRVVSWKEKGKTNSRSCYMEIKKIAPDESIDPSIYMMDEIKDPALRIFSIGSPLDNAKLTTARHGAYSSSPEDWRHGNVKFGFLGLITGLLGTLFSTGYTVAQDVDDVVAQDVDDGDVVLVNSLVNSIFMNLCNHFKYRHTLPADFGKEAIAVIVEHLLLKAIVTEGFLVPSDEGQTLENFKTAAKAAIRIGTCNLTGTLDTGSESLADAIAQGLMVIQPTEITIYFKERIASILRSRLIQNSFLTSPDFPQIGATGDDSDVVGRLTPKFGCTHVTMGDVTDSDNGISGSSLESNSLTAYSLPHCLQARGQLFPKLERVELSNTTDMLVYEFRTSRDEIYYFSVDEIPLVKQEDFLEDMPQAWHLLENTERIDEAPFVLGIGTNFARVHFQTAMGNEAAIALKIYGKNKDEVPLFGKEVIQQPMKQRAKRVNEKTGRTHFTSGKLERIIKELASKVSYTTICTMLQLVIPNGKDPTLKFHHEVRGTVQEVRLVLYAVRKKHLKYLGRIEREKENTRITHLVGVWAKDELVDAYWAFAEDTLEGAFSLVHYVSKMMQIGEGIPSKLLRADLDVRSPDWYFTNMPGRYGASFREASVKVFERDKEKSNPDLVFGFNFSKIANAVAVTAQSVAKSGLLGPTAKNIGDSGVISSLAGSIFGLSQIEPMNEEIDLDFGATPQKQPYHQVEVVYDQKNKNSCVLCSISMSIALIVRSVGIPLGKKEKPEKKILDRVTQVIPVSSIGPGLNITNALNTLEDVLTDYHLEWKKITPTVGNFKSALNMGLPVIVGTKFDKQLTEFPNNLDKPISGPSPWSPFLHCVTMIGYDDADSTFTLLNSYSNVWGRYGAMTIEQDYEGFDRAFILQRKQKEVSNSVVFGVVDVRSVNSNLTFE